MLTDYEKYLALEKRVKDLEAKLAQLAPDLKTPIESIFNRDADDRVYGRVLDVISRYVEEHNGEPTIEWFRANRLNLRDLCRMPKAGRKTIYVIELRFEQNNLL